MHWKNLANYDYLGAYSLEGITDEITVTIRDVKSENVTGPGGKVDKCIVAYFAETEDSGVKIKPMVLNKTNCKTVEKLLGTGDIDAWIGREIIVYATETKMGRDVVPCLRVKDELPQEHYCAVCGNKVSNKVYNSTMKKFGACLCSKECSEAYVASKQQENEVEQ